jgi:hypothetical protein
MSVTQRAANAGTTRYDDGVKVVDCTHDTIDARIEIAFACSTIRFTHGMRYPEDPLGVPLRRISIYDLKCATCHKALTRKDVGTRFEAGGDLHHPRFDVTYG